MFYKLIVATIRQRKKKMGVLGYFLGLIGGAKLQRAKSLKLPGFYICLGLFRY